MGWGGDGDRRGPTWEQVAGDKGGLELPQESVQWTKGRLLPIHTGTVAHSHRRTDATTMLMPLTSQRRCARPCLPRRFQE